MAKIKGEVDVTPQDEAILNTSFLPTINADRAAQVPPLPPFPNVDAYASFVLESTFASYVSGEKRKKKESVGSKYDEADPAVQAQVDTLLGL